MLLLNPGPVTLTERVRQSLLQPDLCHRESEFFDLQEEARTRLLQVYQLSPSEWQAVLITGSGTAAVESMITSLVPENGKVLVIENGTYGERITQIASRYRIAHETLKHDWLLPPDLDRIAASLDANTGITHVAVIHHETTSGRLNNLRALAAVCRVRGVRLLVDGVSSFAAEEINFADTTIAAVAAAANKCLHGVPGVSFVVLRRDELARAATRAFYLDLRRQAQLQDQRDTPFTPAVHAYYGLVEALRELEDDGGWKVRHARYSALAEQVRACLTACGIVGVLPPAETSVVLRAYRLPLGVSYARLHDSLKERGFVIYAAQSHATGELFRISTMGNIQGTDVDRLGKSFFELLEQPVLRNTKDRTALPALR